MFLTSLLVQLLVLEEYAEEITELDSGRIFAGNEAVGSPIEKILLLISFSLS
jgi:hypothetical protein